MELPKFEPDKGRIKWRFGNLMHGFNSAIRTGLGRSNHIVIGKSAHMILLGILVYVFSSDVHSIFATSSVHVAVNFAANFSRGHCQPGGHVP